MNTYQFTSILKKGNKIAKYNVENLKLIRSRKFNASELKEIRKLVEENNELFKNKWNEYFNDK